MYIYMRDSKTRFFEKNPDLFSFPSSKRVERCLTQLIYVHLFQCVAHLLEWKVEQSKMHK